MFFCQSEQSYVFHPIKLNGFFFLNQSGLKPKPIATTLTGIFPRLVLVARFCFEFWFFHCVVCLVVVRQKLFLRQSWKKQCHGLVASSIKTVTCLFHRENSFDLARIHVKRIRRAGSLINEEYLLAGFTSKYF